VGHPNVYATYVDRAGAIWLGTWGKGATRLDPATSRATVLGGVPSSVNSFHADADGWLWAATEGRGLASTPCLRLLARPFTARDLAAAVDRLVG
jgi:streptogramin lyase